jgi:hypothetical protein
LQEKREASLQRIAQLKEMTENLRRVVAARKPDLSLVHEGYYGGYVGWGTGFVRVAKLKIGEACPMHGSPCHLVSRTGFRQRKRAETSRFQAEGIDLVCVEATERDGRRLEARRIVAIDGPSLVLAIGDQPRVAWVKRWKIAEVGSMEQFEVQLDRAPWARRESKEDVPPLLVPEKQDIFERLRLRLAELAN